MRSEVIIMRALQKFGREVIGIGERWVEEEMKEYVRGDICRRRVIDREMDGRGNRFGCKVGEQRCNVCQGRARGEKRKRMIVWNDEEDLRARQAIRVDEKEVQRERALYDMSNDSIEEEEGEVNQDRVRVLNDERVRVRNDERVRVGSDKRVRVLNDEDDKDYGGVQLPTSDPWVDLGVDFDMANVVQKEFEEEMAQDEQVPEI